MKKADRLNKTGKRASIDINIDNKNHMNNY